MVRSDMELAAAATLIRSQLRQVDTNTPVIELQPISALVEQSAAEPRFRTFLLSSFALTCVCRAAVAALIPARRATRVNPVIALRT